MELMEEQKRTYEHGVIQMQNRQLRDNLMIDGMLDGGARTNTPKENNCFGISS